MYYRYLLSQFSPFVSSTGGEIWGAAWSVDEVTQRVIDGGAVLGYYYLSGWLPLPLTLGTTTITFAFDRESISLLVIPARAISSATLARLVNGDRVRFVVLEPAQVAQMRKDGVDVSDYGSVMDFVEKNEVL